MKILRVKRTHIYDVFTGDGWKNWSRYHVKQGKVLYIAGNSLPKIDLIRISKSI